MLIDPLLAYVHFLAVFGLFAALSCELILLRPRFIAQAGGWLHRVDAVYGLTALLVLASGFARAFGGAKGWAFYAHNGFFHLKLGVFLLVVLMSIQPALSFRAWARAARETTRFLVPEDQLRRVRRRVMIELHLLALIPLFAALMSRGFGS
jgi:putative membrane protein